MASNSNKRLLYRYGICLSEGCSKCKSKEVQQVSARKELVCAECGKPLRECRRPLTWWEKNGKKVIGGGIAAVIAVVAVLFGTGVIGGGSTTSKTSAKAVVTQEPKTTTSPNQGEEKHTPKPDTASTPTPEPPVVDSIPEPPVADPKSEPNPQPGGGSTTPPSTKPKGTYQGTLDLGYAKYVGWIKNGKPDGSGVLTYAKEHQVMSSKGIVAKPGDRYEGVFENGKPTFGTLHRTDGNAVKIKR